MRAGYQSAKDAENAKFLESKNPHYLASLAENNLSLLNTEV
jgi:hypothetical protein